MKGKFSRSEAEKNLLYVQNHLEGCGRLKCCGSFRRGLKKVGDLDFVVTHKNQDHPDVLISSIRSLGEVICGGQKKISISLSNEMQCDFYLAPGRLFESYCLFLTGSKAFNIKCRQVAKTLGFRLSEYGLRNSEGIEYATSELGILEILGMSEYADPKLRSL